MSATEDGCRAQKVSSFFFSVGSAGSIVAVAKKRIPDPPANAPRFCSTASTMKYSTHETSLIGGERGKSREKRLSANINRFQRIIGASKADAVRAPRLMPTSRSSFSLFLLNLFPPTPPTHPAPPSSFIPKQAPFPPRIRPARPFKGLSASRRLKRYWSRHARRRRRTP